MEERIRFAVLADKGRRTMTELCAEFRISRKTGYKWLRRYRQFGLAGTREWSRRPGHCPQQTAAAVVRRLVQERRAHPRWGPKKLQVVLRRAGGWAHVPSVSTLGAILQQRGLTVKRRRRRGQVVCPAARTLTVPTRPNEVWAMDFKGWFKTGNGQRCDPLTITDLYSRYLVCCRALPGPTQGGTQRACRAVFRRYGLPEVIRVDNGTPFASMGLARLSRLSVWWLRLGIRVEFIRPASPQLNGSHERMHRTLKAEATQPASTNLRAQQRRFDRWKKQFNEQRPHEAIGMRVPAELYHRSAHRLHDDDKPLRYPDGVLTKPVGSSGSLRYRGATYFLGEAFARETVGLRHARAGETSVYLANVCLGQLGTQIRGRFRPTASIVPGSPHLT